VTALYSLMAATAAKPLGWAPTCVHPESTNLHVDGRDNREEAPAAEVIHITRGDSREHRPDLKHVMLELMVEHQAGMPVRMEPRSGTSRDVHEFGHVIKASMAPLQPTDASTYLVAARALSRADNLQKLADTTGKWLTRVPATLRDPPTALAQATPQTMAPLTAGSRSHGVPATSGGVQQRWGLIASEHRQAHAPHTVGEADAREALATVGHGVPATFLSTVTVRSPLGDGKRGRPSQDAPPVRVVYTIEGALASALATRQALIDQHRCFMLATNALDAARLSPQEVLNGYTGQAPAERGWRCRKDPQLLASACSLNKPERIMALLLVMTVCLLVYAALQSRRRTARKAHGATCPDQHGQPTQTPTARWVFPDFVGIHVLLIPAPWDDLVVHLTAAHQSRLRLLGKPYERLYR
jgi:transposase